MTYCHISTCRVCKGAGWSPLHRSAGLSWSTFGPLLGLCSYTHTNAHLHTAVCAVVAEIGSLGSGQALIFCFFMQIFHEGSDGEEGSLLSV